MKCERCGAVPWEGATLIRQNPKGEVGVWRCESCNQLPVDPELAQVIAEVQNLQDRSKV